MSGPLDTAQEAEARTAKEETPDTREGVLDSLQELLDGAGDTNLIIHNKSYKLNDPNAPRKAVVSYLISCLRGMV